MEPGAVRRPPFGANPTVGERGNDTRRRVMDAALQVFGEVPYSEARVELITERAGCSRPAFYQYFSSKDDVFWALARELGTEMVALAERLEPVTADTHGLDRLTGWIDDFMALHEAWAPVFAAYPAASRDGRAPGGAGAINDRTTRGLLAASSLPDTAESRRVVAQLVAVLIRCSFYAEHAPKGMNRKPLVKGLAYVFHRVLVGPIDGVNVKRGRPRRRRIESIAVPDGPPAGPPLRPRGERTRRLLLDAGAAVLPSRGYHDARVDDVVAAAGVSHGTFYRYFSNMDEFFRVLAADASTHLVERIEDLDLTAPPADLRAWVRGWFDAYEADGGVISTWQEMRASPELAAFSQQVAVGVFVRLEAELARRDFGDPQVDAACLLALLERAPYSVFTLGFAPRAGAIDAMLVILRRGLAGVDS